VIHGPEEAPKDSYRGLPDKFGSFEKCPKKGLLDQEYGGKDGVLASTFIEKEGRPAG